jgi:hypothetical protein
MRKLLIVLSMAISLALLLQDPGGAFHLYLRIRATGTGTSVQTNCAAGGDLTVRQGSHAVTVKITRSSFSTSRLNAVARSSTKITATCNGHPVTVAHLATTGLPVFLQLGISMGLLVIGVLLVMLSLSPPRGPSRRRRRAPVRIYAQ